MLELVVPKSMPIDGTYSLMVLISVAAAYAVTGPAGPCSALI
jgi:hypothetical protein